MTTPLRDNEPSAFASPFSSTNLGDLAGATETGQAQGALGAFDVCHIGVVLRAVVLVLVAVGIVSMFDAANWVAWSIRFSVATMVALPATLLWLMVACAAKERLHLTSDRLQWLAATGLGLACGALGALYQSVLGLSIQGDALSTVIPSALAGAALAGVLSHWLRVRARQQRPADTAARLAELQSRIRPHFLFNTINTAVALVRVDPASAEAVLEDLAELFRVALAEQGQAVTLAQEVTLAQRYLDIEQIRFGKRLQVSWDLDPAAGLASVPPLLLQPLVENAVRHGVEPSEVGGSIKVRSKVHKGQAILTVMNTMPFDGTSRPGNGMALANVRERLRLLHDVEGSLQTKQSEGWWQVQVTLPLKVKVAA